MDNLTHTLAGAVLGKAGLEKRTALAMPTLLIGANLPDIDIVAAFAGHTLDFRRGWTHGVLAIAVLPILLTLGMLAWDRWFRRRRGRTPAGEVRPRQVLLLAYIAVFSHPLLDWLNTYGMRWLMPFDGTWFYGDALFIIDPWVWLVLLIGVFGARRGHRTRIGASALAIATVYGAIMVGTAALGRRMVDEAMRRSEVTPNRVMVGPVPVNPNRRHVIVDAGEVYYTGTLNWLPRPVFTIDQDVIPSNLEHPVAQVAAGYTEARRFLSWSRFPAFDLTELDEGYLVRIDDLRFRGSGRGWATVEVLVPRRLEPRERSPLRTVSAP